MAKTTANPPAAGSRRWTVAAAVVALVLMVAGGIYYAMRPREAAAPLDAASSAAQASPDDALSRKVVLPAIPRRPRPAALSPEQFKDPQVRKSYEIARENPALLEQMPCYCGCYQNPGHTNNLDCFVDKHGETWLLCRIIALEAQQQQNMGTPVAEIKKNIDKKYAR